MPIEFIALGAPIAAKAVVPLVSFLGRSFQGDEEKLIRRSFVKAIREVREERLQSQKKIRTGIGGKALGAAEASYEKTTRPFKRSERSAEKDLASFLTETWAEVLADKASQSSQENAEEEEAEEGQEDQGRAARPPRSWLGALIDFLALTAHEGAKDVDPGDAERQEAQKAWRHALVVAKAPSEDEARGWAKQVAGNVVASWRRTKPLRPLIAQLNSDSQYGLMQAMVLSGQEIAESLRKIAKIAVPTTLFGGGAIALAVLFVDKG